MKKLVSIVLALALVLAMAVASATTITINKNTEANTDVNVDNTTYTAYKILDAEYATNSTTSAGAGDGKVSYTISTSSPWYPAVSALTTYFELGDIGGDATHKTVKLAAGAENTAATAEAIGNALKPYIDGTGSGAVTTNTSDAIEENGIAITAGTAASVSKGYYLIKSSNGVNLVVATTDITMTEKNTYITDDKVVFKNNYNIGDNVTYFITVNLPADMDTTVPVVVHDNMDAVLKFNDDTVVYVSDSAVADPKTIASTSFTALTSAYSVSKPASPSTALDDGCDFHITITPTGLAGKTIVFKFTAKLLDTANADVDIQNSEWSNYGNYTTKPSTPKVKTFDIDLKKVFAGLAAGDTIDTNYTATFELNQGSDPSIKFTVNGSNYTKVDGEVADEGSATLTVHHNETINIKGLAAGSYTLTEITTTNGYNKLPAPIQVTVADDGTYTATMNGTSVMTSGAASIIQVENNSGTELPSTGGIGTTIFYIIGGLLLVGAAVILVARRKAHE